MPDGWEIFNLLDPLIDDSQGDPDSDGLVNLAELHNDTLPQNPDTDNDTLTDGQEVLVLFTNPNSADTDSDLMPDGWEVDNSLNPHIDDSQQDPDSDLLTNIRELEYSTDPQNPDSDEDSIEDGAEVDTYGSSPTNPDSDADTLEDGVEIQTYGTSPILTDTDSDLLSDPDEIFVYSTNPLSADSDEDGLTDGSEILQHNTNPNNADSDGDGVSDGTEIAAGTDPLVADIGIDSDNDGISDVDELELGTDIHHRDTDRDGLEDGWEVERGLDPLQWTYETGEAMENLNNILFFGGGIFLAALVALSGMGFVSRHKISKAMRSRVIFIPAILFLLVFFNTAPMSVAGTTDPGSNSRSGSGTSISLTTKDSPWWGNSVSVSVSLSLSILFEYCDGTVTVSSGGTTLGTFEFRFGRSAFIGTDRESGTFTAPKGADVQVSVSYRHYDQLTDQNLGGVSFGLSISQSEEDGRNEDQKTWPVMRGQLFMMSLGVVILGVLLPTGRVFNYVDKRRNARSTSRVESFQYSEQMSSSFDTMQFGFDDKPDDETE
jgi:hypothetical protein